ncbi:uncharacterized protein LOC144343178 [Saccoglossus kowalevskii]
MSWSDSDQDDNESVLSVTSTVWSGVGREAVKQKAFALCANETSTRLIYDRVISPMTKDGIPCVYDRNEFPLGHTIESIHKSCIKRYPVIILPITKQFNEDFSDDYIEKIFPPDYHLNHLVLCILLESGCRAPTVFQELTMLDFTEGHQEEHYNKQEKRMIKAVKKQINKIRKRTFCVRVIEGYQGKKCIGIQHVLEYIGSSSNEQLRLFHGCMFGQLIYHPLRCVNKLAQRRTVLKRSIGDEKASIRRHEASTSVSFQQLHEINQESILSKCRNISLTSKSPVMPLEPEVDGTRWMWNAVLFGKMVTVHVPSTMEEMIGTGEENHKDSPSQEFLSELSLMEKLQRHDNIIDLYGFCRHPLPIFTITENLEINLLEFLTKRMKQESYISLYELVHDICIPVISAVQYCHTKDIVSRDVIAKNFRVDTGSHKSLSVKYCDFTLARELQNDGGAYGSFRQFIPSAGGQAELVDVEYLNTIYEIMSVVQFVGTENDSIAKRWSAPESFQDPYYYSKKSDAWMLACTLYEILTHGCQPYTELYGVTSDDIMHQVTRGLRIKQPACIPTTLFDIILHSLVAIPNKRLSVDTLLSKVVAYSKNLPKPNPSDTQKMHLPPQRDHNQRMQPERGIPEDLGNYYDSPMSSSATSTFPCRLEDITSSDVQRKHSETAGAFGSVTLEERLNIKLFPHGRTRLEIVKLTRLSHPNIGRVLSCTVHGEVTFQVSEYFDTKQSLLKMALYKQGFAQALDYLLQVASGMVYLHENYLIHCDLRAAHIYISGNGQAKIGRLGRACVLEIGLYDRGLHDSVKIRQMLPDQIRWSPIEVVCGNIFSQASDIFMFAQLCWEMFNAYDANKGLTPNMLVPYPHSADSEILNLLTQRRHQLQPSSCPDWLYKLMKMCWLDERSRRPSFKLIGQCLQQMSLDSIINREDNESDSTVYEALQSEDEHLFGYFTMGTTKYQADCDRDPIYYKALPNVPYEERVSGYYEQMLPVEPQTYTGRFGKQFIQPTQIKSNPSPVLRYVANSPITEWTPRGVPHELRSPQPWKQYTDIHADYEEPHSATNMRPIPAGIRAQHTSTQKDIAAQGKIPPKPKPRKISVSSINQTML